MEAIKIRIEDPPGSNIAKKGSSTKIVKETNKYFDWYKDAPNNWEVVEEFEIEEVEK